MLTTVSEPESEIMPQLRLAAFTFSNLSISPSERKLFTVVPYFIKTGETVTISVDVMNEE